MRIAKLRRGAAHPDRTSRRPRGARQGGLLEFETLSGDEIKDLLMGKRPTRESVIEPAAPRTSAVPTAGKGQGRARPEPGPMDPQRQA
jgi:cell division protease FtsH